MPTIQDTHGGEVTIKLQNFNQHVAINIRQPAGITLQCILCDKHSPTADGLQAQTCIRNRVVTIRVHDEE